MSAYRARDNKDLALFNQMVSLECSAIFHSDLESLPKDFCAESTVIYASLPHLLTLLYLFAEWSVCNLLVIAANKKWTLCKGSVNLFHLLY